MFQKLKKFLIYFMLVMISERAMSSDAEMVLIYNTTWAQIALNLIDIGLVSMNFISAYIFWQKGNRDLARELEREIRQLRLDNIEKEKSIKEAAIILDELEELLGIKHEENNNI